MDKRFRMHRLGVVIDIDDEPPPSPENAVWLTFMPGVLGVSMSVDETREVGRRLLEAADAVEQHQRTG